MAAAPAAAAASSPVPSSTPDWARKYPPLFLVALAAVIVLAVLPSALNLPQSNPTQTLEYAPVPDEGDDAPPQGNLSALGLGSSSGIKGGGAAGEGPGGGLLPPEEEKERKKKPVQESFRCTDGKPDRQTFDPLAPPCVPFFEGDNYGATYQGVEGDEIRLLVYMDGGIRYLNASNSGNMDTEGGKFYDLMVEPDEDEPEHLTVQSLRVWQDYFNARFQTYKRYVHFYVYFGSKQDAEGRRQDAAEMFTRVKPFAVLSFASEGNEDDFIKAMARRGVLNFGSFGMRPADLFNQFPKMMWGYLPSVEQQAETYVSYICQKVINKPAVWAGGVLNGRPRKIGIIYTTDTRRAGLRRMAEIVEDKVKACGGEIAMRQTWDSCCLAQDASDPGAEQSREMAEFQTAGITTILWPGGINGQWGRSAQANGYQPEWIVLGDSEMDANWPIKLSQNTGAFDGRAVVITPQTLEPALHQQKCYRAFREIDPSRVQDADLAYTCEWYKNLFQFFTGVQVAGPRLGPTSLDKGFHAIPQKYEGHPDVPACFYLPGDYTCVKDAQVEYWDAESMPPGDNRAGCWRAIEGGRRYAPWKWPPGNIDAQVKGNEPCNAYDARVRFNT